jgi:hypothetical protein
LSTIRSSPRARTPSTALYNLFAEYLGWVEIITQRLEFLDLGSVDRNREFNGLLAEVGDAMGTSQLPDRVFQIFRTNQRAIGQLMIDDRIPQVDERRCIGFATFTDRLDDPAFAKWFDPMQARLRRLAKIPGRPLPRLVAIQNALVELVEFFGGPTIGYPPEDVRKIELDSSPASVEFIVCVARDLYSSDAHEDFAPDLKKVANRLDDAMLGDPIPPDASDADERSLGGLIDRRCLRVVIPNNETSLSQLSDALKSCVRDDGVTYLLVTSGEHAYVLDQRLDATTVPLPAGTDGGFDTFRRWLDEICQPRT